MSVEVNVLWMKSCFTSIHHGLPAWSAICYRLLHASFSDAATSRHAAITFARSALLMVELDAAWDSPRRNDVEGSCAMRRIVIKCQSSNANGWFVNMDGKESYNKGACCQATSLWVSRRDAYCSLDTRCRRSVSGDCIQQTSNWATWRYTNTFLYIHFYIYMYVCIYVWLLDSCMHVQLKLVFMP